MVVVEELEVVVWVSVEEFLVVSAGGVSLRGLGAGFRAWTSFLGGSVGVAWFGLSLAFFAVVAGTAAVRPSLAP